MCHLLLLLVMFPFSVSALAAQTASGTVHLTVRASDKPVDAVEVLVAGATRLTDASGRLTLIQAPGSIDLTVVKTGFAPITLSVTVVAGVVQEVFVELQPLPTVEEEVTVVASTRTDRRLEDQPMRVEVLAREEIEEKMLMTPGDIVMMLNETGGLRVQTTSPSLGAASVRIQGMRGPPRTPVSSCSAPIAANRSPSPRPTPTCRPARPWTRSRPTCR